MPTGAELYYRILVCVQLVKAYQTLRPSLIDRIELRLLRFRRLLPDLVCFLRDILLVCLVGATNVGFSVWYVALPQVLTVSTEKPMAHGLELFVDRCCERIFGTKTLAFALHTDLQLQRGRQYIGMEVGDGLRRLTFFLTKTHVIVVTSVSLESTRTVGLING